MKTRYLFGILMLLSLPVNAEVPVETYGVLTLDRIPRHTILVNTFSQGATLFDADTQQMLGMISTGIGANAFEIDRSAGVLRTAETYLSRHTRGDRTDVISTYDIKPCHPKAKLLFRQNTYPAPRCGTTPVSLTMIQAQS